MRKCAACGFGSMRGRVCPECGTDSVAFAELMKIESAERSAKITETAARNKWLTYPAGAIGAVGGAVAGLELGGPVGALVGLLLGGFLAYRYIIPAIFATIGIVVLILFLGLIGAF